MTKRPSLFAPKSVPADGSTSELAEAPGQEASPPTATTRRPPSRVGKRVLSVYLDPVAWNLLRRIAFDNETTMQALGEEALNLLFEKYRVNRSA